LEAGWRFGKAKEGVVTHLDAAFKQATPYVPRRFFHRQKPEMSVAFDEPERMISQ